MKNYVVVQPYRDAETGTRHHTVGATVRLGAEKARAFVAQGLVAPLAPKAKRQRKKGTPPEAGV